MKLRYHKKTGVVYVNNHDGSSRRVSWFGEGHVKELIKQDEDFASMVRNALEDTGHHVGHPHRTSGWNQ